VRSGNSSGPSECSGSLPVLPALPPTAVLTELAARSEFFPAGVAPYWLDAPALPLAVSSAVRFFLGGPIDHG
jgi:hypothetical protein